MENNRDIFTLEYYLKKDEEKRQKSKEASKRYYQNNKEWIKNKKRTEKYGLSFEDHVALLERQQHACAICLKEDENLEVDHCHNTGKVRGLLCSSCNVRLYHVEKIFEFAEKAVKYLKNCA